MPDREESANSQPLDFGYRPLPPTERREPIKAALKVLADPEIPDEHAEGNFNCGECWACIEGTVALIGLFREERARAAGSGRDNEPLDPSSV